MCLARLNAESGKPAVAVRLHSEGAAAFRLLKSAPGIDAASVAGLSAHAIASDAEPIIGILEFRWNAGTRRAS